MKPLVFLFSALLLQLSLAQDVVIKLTPDKNNEPKNRNGDYEQQIIDKFEQVLKKNAKLRQQFEKFENDAVGKEDGDRSGRYMGISTRHFVLFESEDVNFSVGVGEVATREYTQTVVVYYSYQEGYRKGMEAINGVFATFVVKGKERYEMQKDDKSKLLDKNITATFKGFSKTLTAEKPEEPQPNGE